MTAIEFCYQYNRIEPELAVFNWTVLIFEQITVTEFRITKMYDIESRPASLTGGECENIDGGKAKCCDRVYISSFNFQTNNFIFGVTESAQRNNHYATLLGFSDSLPQYRVSTLFLSKVGLTLSVDSTVTVPNSPLAQRGLRMLWFVLGKPTDIV